MADLAVAVPPPALTAVGVVSPVEQQRLTCVGTLMTKDIPPPGSHVMADGLIDFARRRVEGFGLGGQPIIVLTASDVRFGSPAPEDPGQSNVVEGWIDRQSGSTRIVVRSQRDPSEVQIEFTLDCEFDRPNS